VHEHHHYVPLLMTAPGFGWITSYTVACEIGDINRFSTPVKLTGYSGLCPRVKQSGEMDQRGPLSKHGPRYLRWGLMEASIHAAAHPFYKQRYQTTKRRLGRQRGANVAQIDLARKLTEAVWHMLTRTNPSLRRAPRIVWLPDSSFWNCATGASPTTPGPGS
jgi:transposase